MRTTVLLSALCFSATAFAETVFIEPTQDNTVYEHSQGALSNGSGDHLFVGRNGSGDIRRGLISFKELDAIPDHATILSVKLHLHSSRQDPPAMAIKLFRVTADWCEGGSHAAGEEDDGAAAQAGDATWIWRFWPDVPWNSPGGDFVAGSSGQAEVDAIGWYTFGSSNDMVADVADWKDNPEANFGWILTATAGVGAVERFHSRSNVDAASRPVLEVEYGVTGTASDYSGLWYDPDLDGEGYNVYKTPFGWLVYYFGYSTAGELLWLTSDLVTLDQLTFGQPIEFPMLIGVPGTFHNPSSSAELQPYGTLSVIFDSCTAGEFTLNGLDGQKISNVVKLVGVENTQCQ